MIKKIVFKIVIIIICIFVNIPLCAEEQNSEVKRQFCKKLYRYGIYYGPLYIGEAKIVTDPTQHLKGNKTCSKIDIYGYTGALLKVLVKVKHHWSTYIDINTLQPVESYRCVEEGNFKAKEKIFYQQEKKLLIYKNFDFDTNQVKETKKYAVQNNIYDFISAAWKVKSLKKEQLLEGKLPITCQIFFNQELFDYKFFLTKRKSLSTKIGKINSFVLVPSLPDNDLFAKKSPIKMYFSDDQERTLLQVEFKLSIGSVGLYIIEKRDIKEDETS